jgi:L-cystine uptake protein TcyP (sodium:dicarboxylate symporter family)
MFSTQLLNDALTTVAFLVGVVIAISVWVVTASALHQRHERKTHIRAIEQHLADVAEQSQAPAR